MLKPRTALLQVLLEGPNHGLALANRVAELTEQRLNLTPGGIYPPLRQMESDGLVTSHEEAGPPERGGRPRVVYTLTAHGRICANAERGALLSLLGL